MHNIESILTENRIFNPPAAFSQEATVANMETYRYLYAQAEENPEHFWAELANEHLVWHKNFSQVLDQSNPPFYRWFHDGLINVSYNCLDHPISQGLADKTALIFEADDGQMTKISYQGLHKKVCRIANGLKQLGVRKGDRVIIYMPMSIEAVASMQACARIGAIHSVVFAGFSAKSLQERIIDAGACIVMTTNEQIRGGKRSLIKHIVDEAISLGDCESIKHVLVNRRSEARIEWHADRDIWLDELIEKQNNYCAPEWVEAEHPLFILYTSGSTGKPKGVQHSSAGYLLWAILTMRWVFDIKASDVFWCTADVGWVTGHTYVTYGPLATGTTQLIFEGLPIYPDAGRFWQMIERHRVTIFYTAPTAIRTLIKLAQQNSSCHPQQYDLSSLRLLGTVGEPINPEAWMWYYEQVGNSRCPIVDTFWQTETGGHVIAPLPGAMPLVPGSCSLPLPGIAAAVVDETGLPVENGQGGLLVIKRPWPSMIRTIWNDPERFKQTYFPAELGGFYLAGDGAVRDAKTTYFTIMGRIDDVLNVSGHRLGTMEIESALVAHTLVAEAAVVAKPDTTSGEAICAFVVLKQQRPQGEQAQRMADELRQWVTKQIGAIAKPKEIRFGDNLPKTRSGKIMRRLLRTVAKGETISQDISTLENPDILTQFEQVQ